MYVARRRALRRPDRKQELVEEGRKPGALRRPGPAEGCAPVSRSVDLWSAGVCAGVCERERQRHLTRKVTERVGR